MIQPPANDPKLQAAPDEQKPADDGPSTSPLSPEEQPTHVQATEAAASSSQPLPATAAPGLSLPAGDPAPEPDQSDAAGAAAGEEPAPGQTPAEREAVLAASRRHTRRSFVVGGAAAVAGYLGYEWLEKSPARDMQPAPYREAFQANANLSRRLFRDRALAPTYPLSRAEELRVNGVYGLKRMLDPASYRLQLVGMRDAAVHPEYVADVTAWQYRYLDGQTKEDQGHDTKTAPRASSAAPPPAADTAEKMAPEPMVETEKRREVRAGRMPRGREEAGESRSTLTEGTPGLLLTMADIQKLPRHELVTQFKCIEGWSQVVHWAGVRMADFLEAYPPATISGAEPRYVYMETPDGDYYVGYDMEVCRHPQTLLVTEMMGAPLTQFHGAPLRVHMPTRYGYKQIKRVGLISYTDIQPDDYWTKLGYDWYAGL